MLQWTILFNSAIGTTFSTFSKVDAIKYEAFPNHVFYHHRYGVMSYHCDDTLSNSLMPLRSKYVIHGTIYNFMAQSRSDLRT